MYYNSKLSTVNSKTYYGSFIGFNNIGQNLPIIFFFQELEFTYNIPIIFFFSTSYNDLSNYWTLTQLFVATRFFVCHSQLENIIKFCIRSILLALCHTKFVLEQDFKESEWFQCSRSWIIFVVNLPDKFSLIHEWIYY